MSDVVDRLTVWLERLRPVHLLVPLLLAAAAWLVVVRPASTQEITVHFAEATKLHEGDRVSVLDVQVGRVLSVEPRADHVEVRLSVDGDQPLPADVRASIVAPTLVSVRHVELSPVYAGGPRLDDDATIPVSRTAVPVEWHEVQTQVSRLASALGPDGAGDDGALGRLLETTADNLAGQGEQLGDTIVSMSDALGTLADHRGDLFATVRNLDVLVKALESSDDTVRLFNDQLATVSTSLADDEDALRTVLGDLDAALRDVQRFADDHGESATSTLGNLQGLTRTLSDHRQHLADILQSAPTALSNYYNIYYPDGRAMTGTFVAQYFDSPAVFICSTLYSLGGSPTDCENLLSPIADFLKVETVPIGINLLERNGGSGANDGLTPTPGATAQAPDADGLDLLGGLMLGLVP